MQGTVAYFRTGVKVALAMFVSRAEPQRPCVKQHIVNTPPPKGGGFG
jgi:hypothetical protein